MNTVCLCSEEQSRLAARKYARIVQKLGFPASFLNFEIQNLVATYNTFPLSLERLAHVQHCRSGDTGYGHISHNLPSEVLLTIPLEVFWCTKLMF